MPLITNLKGLPGDDGEDGAVNVTESPTSPGSPAPGDVWVDTDATAPADERELLPGHPALTFAHLGVNGNGIAYPQWAPTPGSARSLSNSQISFTRFIAVADQTVSSIWIPYYANSGYPIKTEAGLWNSDASAKLQSSVDTIDPPTNPASGADYPLYYEHTITPLALVLGYEYTLVLKGRSMIGSSGGFFGVNLGTVNDVFLTTRQPGGYSSNKLKIAFALHGDGNDPGGDDTDIPSNLRDSSVTWSSGGTPGPTAVLT